MRASRPAAVMAMERDTVLVDQDRQARVAVMLPRPRAFGTLRFVISDLGSVEPDAEPGE